MRATLLAATAATALVLTGTQAAEAGLAHTAAAHHARAAVSATGTWTVTPGGQFSAEGARTTDIGPLVCDSPGFRVIKGRLKSGSGLSSHIGTIFVAERQPLGCHVGTGTTTTLTLTFTGLPWRIVALKYGPKTGSTLGDIYGISATIANTTGGPACTATLAGTGGKTTGRDEFKYKNSGEFLLLGVGDLRFSNVTGCTGELRTGQAGEITAKFGALIAKTSGATETITSP